MEVFKGENAQSQGTVSTRKRAGSERSDAAMKRPRKEQTSAQDVSSCGNPVHGTWQKLKPSLPTLPGGLMHASYLGSPRRETPVGKGQAFNMLHGQSGGQEIGPGSFQLTAHGSPFGFTVPKGLATLPNKQQQGPGNSAA